MTQPQPRKRVSIIIPVYNEEKNLKPLYQELKRVITDLPYEFEILLIDDGSSDASAVVADKIHRQDGRFKLLQFARNFGKEAAVSAGLHQAQGDAAIIIDADMQMPPALMKDFLSSWEEGAEVVVGVFASRNMHWLRRFGAKVFYRVMQTIAHTKITPHATDYRLLDRQVIDTFNRLPEHNRITRGMIDWLGYERRYVPFEQAPRLHGKPTYSFKQLVALALNSFTAYSLVPLKLAGYLGILILSVSIPASVFFVVERFVLNDPFGWSVSGTFFLALLLLALIGAVLACLGLIALYIAHIHAEVTDRPLYILRKEPRVQQGALGTSASDETQTVQEETAV